MLEHFKKQWKKETLALLIAIHTNQIKYGQRPECKKKTYNRNNRKNFLWPWWTRIPQEIKIMNDKQLYIEHPLN